MLVQQGFAPSRAAALRLIAAGRVSVKVGADETAPLLKPAQLLPAEAVLRVGAGQDQTKQGPSRDPT
jgi:predicted rRNA methylase YqxC with S4 and FtsJ domains